MRSRQILKVSSALLTVNLGLLLSVFVWFANGEKEPSEDSNALPKPSSNDNLLHPTINGGPIENVGFLHAFIAAISVILVSEIGDKTFFIAAIMAMRHPRLIVFGGAISALILMTILSALFGWLANVIPKAYTFYISTALFAIFGLKMLKEGYHMSESEAQEELEEVQTDLRKKEEEYEKDSILTDPESGSCRKSGVFSATSRIIFQAFTLTFLAEWGDRSQLTTIILGAREDVSGVIIGGIMGHSICTGIAVLGGRMIAQRISVKTVTIVGGVVFLLFAFSALFFDPNAD